MRQLTAFTKKEFMELVRTGRLLLMAILFVLFGIMNPAIAKITPWLMEFLSEDLAEAGMVVSAVKVDAMASWTQFYKNVPMALLIFIILFSGILTSEYTKGTLINVLTKGLSRWKVIAAKTILTAAVWTAGYWVCYGITYGYNAYFWDNHIASHLFFAALCFYVAGLWLISVIMLMSAVFSSSYAVLAGTGGIFLVFYLAGMFPRISKFLPVKLMGSSGLLAASGLPADFIPALVVTGVLTAAGLLLAVAVFNKKGI